MQSSHKHTMGNAKPMSTYARVKTIGSPYIMTPDDMQRKKPARSGSRPFVNGNVVAGRVTY